MSRDETGIRSFFAKRLTHSILPPLKSHVGRTRSNHSLHQRSLQLYFGKNPKCIMKGQYFIILVFLFTVHALFGQKDETLFGRNGLHLTGAWGSTDPGFSTFSGETAFMHGGFLALEFNKTMLAGIGGSRTSDAVSLGQNGQFDLDYNGLMLGFVPNSFKVIHPKFSFVMGGGKLKVRGEDDDNVFVVQPGVGGEINVFRWFKFGLEGGYRFVSDVNQTVLTGSDISSFFVELKLRFGWSWRG